MALLSRLARWGRHRRRLALLRDGHIVSQDEFRRVLERERDRADRNGNVFSVVLFTADGDDGLASLNRLADWFRQRLRKTDIVGLLDGARLGVAMLDTGVTGATKLCGDILRDLSSEIAAHEMFVYPDLPLRTEPTESEDESDDTHSGGERPEPSEAMRRLFVRPMPGWKRLVDVVGALVGLVAALPVLLLAALAVKLTSAGPIFFRQRRAGLGGRPFTIVKFRTMVAGAAEQQSALRPFSEQDGPAFKLANDPRVTWVGRFLRRTCIDELPQLWNVLCGEMSLVGPRPLPCREAALCRGWERRRLDVTPGLTCIWQVRRAFTVPFADWMRMDRRYIRQQSFGSDIGLLGQTVVKVLFRGGSR